MRAGEAEHLRTRAWYCSNLLVELDQKVAAPLAGGRRSTAGGEDLRGRFDINIGSTVQMVREVEKRLGRGATST
jgi:hypothetical protein